MVNGVLTALGWANKDIEPEAPSGTGEFLDYELWTQDQQWMVVEAKRAGQTFDLSDAGTKRSGSHLRAITSLNSQGGTALRDAMKQAATYCNDKSISLACVTNGFQWLFFRGLSSKLDVPTPVFKAVMSALSERDETADLCTDSKPTRLRSAISRLYAATLLR